MCVRFVLHRLVRLQEQRENQSHSVPPDRTSSSQVERSVVSPPPPSADGIFWRGACDQTEGSSCQSDLFDPVSEHSEKHTNILINAL